VKTKIINDLEVEELSKKFTSSYPFHYIVIDDFLDLNLAKSLKENFPKPDQQTWWLYDNPLEKKLAFNKIENLDDSFSRFFSYVNSNDFLSLLTILTNVQKLKSDSNLDGGGLHLIKQGGKLDIHEDFNIHKGLGMLRKLNLILYLNDPWEEEWGGHLEIWNKDMTKLCNKILPKFNRAVIFRTDMTSNHGHPHPLTCPDDKYRISLATYYYVEHPKIESIHYKSTVYKKLPGCDDGLDELRELRKTGRLQNLTSFTNKK
jgi:Rps23 Pro-64 3,4-dihydroxylase Tpa1-like proline 4-hydroxylase